MLQILLEGKLKVCGGSQSVGCKESALAAEQNLSEDETCSALVASSVTRLAEVRDPTNQSPVLSILKSI